MVYVARFLSGIGAQKKLVTQSEPGTKAQAVEWIEIMQSVMNSKGFDERLYCFTIDAICPPPPQSWRQFLYPSGFRTNPVCLSKKGSTTMKKTIIRTIATLTLVTATVLATAYLTYRTTMQNIQVEVARDTVYLTVFGQTDEYVIGE